MILLFQSVLILSSPWLMPHAHSLTSSCFPEQRAYSWLSHCCSFLFLAYFLFFPLTLPLLFSSDIASSYSFPKNSSGKLTIILGDSSTMSFHCKDTCINSKAGSYQFAYGSPSLPHGPGIIINITFFHTQKYLGLWKNYVVTLLINLTEVDSRAMPKIWCWRIVTCCGSLRFKELKRMKESLGQAAS